MTKTIATVQALALRPSRASPPMNVDAIHALAGLGLGGDVHADRLSPRQVLLAGAGVYGEYALPAHTLGENLLADLDTARLASGTVLQIGKDVLLRLMFQCETCGQLDGRSGGDRGPLARTLAGRRGVLARVVAGGIIRPGDRIRDLGVLAPPWPDDWRARAVRILAAMPPGSVVEYGVLARLAGVQPSYCRALPGVLARLAPELAGRAVPARASAAAAASASRSAAAPPPRWDGGGLFDDAGDAALTSSAA